MTTKYTMQEKRDFASNMRRNMTRAEQQLWWKLSRNQFGYRFCRQFPLRGYIVDFYCASLRMIIEVDGSVHEDENIGADDEQRERILENYGFLVLRFSNEDILDHMTVVLTRLWEECSTRRAALKAFSSQRNTPSSTSRPCGSVEKPLRAKTVDKLSVHSEPRIPATDEDIREVNEAWRKLVGASVLRSAQMTGAQLTTAAERVCENTGIGQWLKKRNESAALTLKGMHIAEPHQRKA